MEKTNKVSATPHAEKVVNLNPDQPDVWVPVTQKTRVRKPNGQEKIELVPPKESQPSRGNIHACKASRRGYQLARDQLKRADRDLAETAAFIAASLTTITAIQAVISIAKGDLGLSQKVLQLAFQSYIAIFISIFVLGAFRAWRAIRKRSKAEREIDLAKKGMFEFCPMEQWPKLEE
jgi:hypothetical protein